MLMRNPLHPGELIRHGCLEPLGLTVTEGARVLGVTRQALNNLVNGKAGISPEMAIRLSKAFGSSPETWLGMQMEYDLAQALKRADELDVKRYEPAGSSAAAT
jgi:addiction module HigA family antidote